MRLSDYRKTAPKKFWDTFPSASLPLKCSTQVNVKALENRVNSAMHLLTDEQIQRANKIIGYLKNGAPAHQKDCLPSCFVPNANSTYLNGPEISDAVAWWLINGFAAGPFNEPPLMHFRVNPLMAIVNSNKVRPVLNVSLPENCSFNSNIDRCKMEKVFMSSPRSFGYSILDCGKNAIMSKFDSCDAYKLIPAVISDLRIQGFMWLEKYFVENRQIFGARTSVANYDMLGNTVRTLSLVNCDIPSHLVHRHLDDIPVVAPSSTNWCQDFSKEFQKVSKDVGIKLAEECKKNEKAFINQTNGKVLGIIFDSKNLTWELPDDKKKKCLRLIHDAINSENISLLNMQKLMGNLNFVSLMCPFLNGFKYPLNSALASLQKNPKIVCKLSQEAKNDLSVWAAFLLDEVKVNPISPRPIDPPLFHKKFISDAAGCNETDIEVGVGCLGLNEDGVIVWAYQMFWDKHFISEACDNKGCKLGHKTTTLEMIGLLLPFLLCSRLLRNQHIVFLVDNLACVYGWENRSVKGDETASIIIRAIMLLAAKIGCYVHVKHLPRVSSWEADTVDRMSRKLTTRSNDRKMLDSFKNPELPEPFVEWLKNPREDWDLPVKLVDCIDE